MENKFKFTWTMSKTLSQFRTLLLSKFGNQAIISIYTLIHRFKQKCLFDTAAPSTQCHSPNLQHWLFVSAFIHVRNESIFRGMIDIHERFEVNWIKIDQLMSLALLFYYLMLNIFRMLIQPSSGTCDLFVELFYGLYFSGTMRVGVTLWFGWVVWYPDAGWSLHPDTTPKRQKV